MLNIEYQILNKSTLALECLQVKTESQDDSIQLQFELSDASKVGNLPDFSIV